MTAPRRLIPALCLLSAVLCLPLPAQPDRVNGRAFATRSQVIAQHGMAATSHPLATQVALDVMKRGGTAVDAAIAANAAIGLMEPTGNGMGGDLFAIVWSAADKKLYGLNASGRSPLGLSREQLMADLGKLGRDTIPPRGFLPISVPGAVDGWFQLHGKFGRLPMKDVLAPAIRYARDGFPVTQYIAYGWGIGVRNAQADKILEHVTREHYASMVHELATLRDALRVLTPQLYLQALAITHLIPLVRHALIAPLPDTSVRIGRRNAEPIELRAADDGDITFEGVASSVEKPYLVRDFLGEFTTQYDEFFKGATGRTEVQMDNPAVSLEQTMVAMQKAQIGFQATLQVRNRLVSAYSDIMNMQV